MFFEGQFAGEPYSTGKAHTVMRAALKNLAYQRTQQYIPYGTVLHHLLERE
jgi:hypothetical protein